MAATVSAWSKPGAWALDSEENETELLHQHNEEPVNGAGAGAGAADYPSLSAAAATKTKKKKAQTISLQEFTKYGAPKPAQSAAGSTKGLTPEEIMMLPSGPRQRSAEELDQSRLGGGFRSYGSSYDRPARGSSDRQGGFGRDSDREIAPSRADETDDWGAGKKSSASSGFERRDRGERGSFFSDSHSKADESDNWGANKAFVPSSGRRFDRKSSFESNGGSSESDSDKWTKRKEENGSKFGSGSGGGGAFDSLRERRGGYEFTNGVDSENWGRKREEGDGVAVAVGVGGRPKLNLQRRTLPLAEAQQNGNGNEIPVKPKGSNPFGEARPREEVLKEKGQDWKEIDQKLESLKKNEVSESFANGKPSMSEDKTEKSWRKSEPIEDHPSSAEETVNGAVEESGDGETQV